MKYIGLTLGSAAILSGLTDAWADYQVVSAAGATPTTMQWLNLAEDVLTAAAGAFLIYREL